MACDDKGFDTCAPWDIVQVCADGLAEEWTCWCQSEFSNWGQQGCKNG
jgi:hypothetical protein